jgi:hypothetical protein
MQTMPVIAPPRPRADGNLNTAPISSNGARTRLLEADPDLGRQLDAQSRRSATALTVPVLNVWRGHWRPPEPIDAGALGLLVLDGLMLRRVRFADAESTELVGPGDLLRPWVDDADGFASTSANWHVAEPARLALLGRNFTQQCTHYPGLVAELLDRVLRRARRQGIAAAIATTTRVDRRLLLVLAHLGERFGRVTPDGLAVQVTLTHEVLANLVGARRPTVTTALGQLRREGLIARNGARSGWIVTTRGCEALAEAPTDTAR